MIVLMNKTQLNISIIILIAFSLTIASCGSGSSAGDHKIPVIRITSPQSGSSFKEGESIAFRAQAYDPQQGNMSGTSIVWTSSINGELGTGTSLDLNNLSIGTHIISAAVTDLDGHSGSAWIFITIVSSGSLLPEAPVNLTAQAVSSSRINITWEASGSGETGYIIERKTGEHGTYAEINRVTSGVLTYADTGRSGLTTYYYRVYAYNTSGNSSCSNEASATTLSYSGTPDGGSGFSSGGGQTSSKTYTQQNSIGEPFVGTSDSANYTHQAGFVPAVQSQ